MKRLAVLFLTLIFAGAVPVMGRFVALNDGPVIPVGFAGEIDAGGVRQPEIVWDGQYVRLYYTAIDAEGVRRIALAVSQDLAHWIFVGVVMEPGAGGDFDSDGVWGPSVLLRDGIYELFYTGSSNGFYSIGRALSSDGLTFYPSNDGQPVLDPSWNPETFDFQGVANPSVIEKDGVWVMLYEGFDSSVWKRVGLAVSSDGNRFLRIRGEDGSGSVLGKGPHGFDDGGALEPELSLTAGGEIRLVYTSLHY